MGREFSTNSWQVVGKAGGFALIQAVGTDFNPVLSSSRSTSRP
jgi:hypothetical protein